MIKRCVMSKEYLTDEEKIKIAQNTYLKDWQAKNKDKVREYKKRYWLKKFEKLQEDGVFDGE